MSSANQKLERSIPSRDSRLGAITVVVVDDDEAVRDSLTDYLETQGWGVLQADSGEAALALAKAGKGDIFITDIRMPKMDGLTLLRRLRELDPQAEVLITTGFSNEQSAIEALKAGAFDYFRKPLNAVDVDAALQRTRRFRELRLENERLHAVIARTSQRHDSLDYVGQSEASHDLLHHCQRLSSSPSTTVLIQGETGVGKEVVARLLHRLTFQSGAPFVALNCGGLAESLLEGELFGHEKGAYTGADRRAPGVFEMGIGGTVMLDEISEMSLSSQSRFLRVLEDRRLRRLGGNREISLGETRIIATTNGDLEAMVEAGSFREDLYYRLQVVTLILPPLRERPADIIPLAHHFAAMFGRNRGETLGFTEAAQAALLAHAFPGNARELRNRVERASIFATGDEMGPRDLGLVVEAGTDVRIPVAESDLDLQAMEVQLIRQAIAQAETHVGAAERLGITPQALYRKLEKYGLPGVS